MSNNNSIVVMQVCDGFTDQILKLSFSIFIRDTFNRNVKLDLTFYDNNKKDFLGIDDREFILTKLFNNIKFEVATQEEIKKSKENFIDHTIGKDKILSELKKTNKSIYLDHKIVWIRYFYNLDFTKYFLLDDYLYKLLNDRQINILNDINNNESIAIHIRRGDYIYFANMVNIKIPSIDYYLKSFEYFYTKNKHSKFYIFSNNIQYVKDNIIPFIQDVYNYEIIDGNKEYVDFYLISKCKHLVQSNGKFSEIAFRFNNYKNKELISIDNSDDIFNKEILEKYKEFTFDRVKFKSYFVYSDIPLNSIINIINLIDKNNIKNIIQIGLLDGVEIHNILNYAVKTNKNLMLNCFEINDRELVGFDVRNFNDEENKKFNLHINKTPMDIESTNIIKNTIDFILIANENSSPLLIFYLLYIYPYMKDDIIIVFNKLNNINYSLFSTYLFDMYDGKKSLFFNFSKKENDNVGYIKINKNKLLTLIKNISSINFDDYDNKFFYKNIFDIRDDYYNYYDIESAYSRLNNLKEYMQKHNIEHRESIIENIKTNIEKYNKNRFSLFKEKIYKTDYQNNIDKIKTMTNNKINYLDDKINYLDYKINEIKNRKIKIFGIDNFEDRKIIYIFGIKITLKK